MPASHLLPCPTPDRQEKAKILLISCCPRSQIWYRSESRYLMLERKKSIRHLFSVIFQKRKCVQFWFLLMTQHVTEHYFILPQLPLSTVGGADFVAQSRDILCLSRTFCMSPSNFFHRHHFTVIFCAVESIHM